MIDDWLVVSIYYTNDFKLSEHSNLWIHPHNLNFVRILSEYRKWWTAEGIIITRNKNYFLFLFLNWMIFPFYEHYDERENDKEKLPLSTFSLFIICSTNWNFDAARRDDQTRCALRVEEEKQHLWQSSFCSWLQNYWSARIKLPCLRLMSTIVNRENKIYLRVVGKIVQSQ